MNNKYITLNALSCHCGDVHDAPTVQSAIHNAHVPTCGSPDYGEIQDMTLEQ